MNRRLMGGQCGPALLLLLLGPFGCADDGPVDLQRDAGADLAPAADVGGDSGGTRRVDFVVQGCAERTPTQCLGSAPLSLTFVPVDLEQETVVSWDLGEGGPLQPARTITHTYTQPGTYTVTLAISRAGGTESERKVEFVRVAAAAPGGPCYDSGGCADGTCVCVAGECEPALLDGFCLRGCGDGADCPTDPATECVDLSLPAGRTTGGPLEPWREVLCLPACKVDGECTRPGFSCRAVRAVTGGWVDVCLPAEPRAIGEPCRGPSAALDDGRCVGGVCLAVGASGSCSSLCETRGCPVGADCVRFSSDVGSGAAPVCLKRCEQGDATCDSDALLACEQPDAAGDLGFSLTNADSGVSGYCAPRRCAENGPACGLGGSCDTDRGGFCLPQDG